MARIFEYECELCGLKTTADDYDTVKKRAYRHMEHGHFITDFDEEFLDIHPVYRTNLEGEPDG